jgi:hypothetical protein
VACSCAGGNVTAKFWMGFNWLQAGFSGGFLIQLVANRVQWRVLVKAVMKLLISLMSTNFDQVVDYQFIRNKCFPCR